MSAHKGLNPEKVRAAVEEYGGHRAAARALGVDHSTIGWHMRKVTTVPKLPDEHRTIERLIQDRKDEFERKRVDNDAHFLVPVKVHMPGPIGIVHFGDPHIDDPGCDISAIERDTDTVRNTEGMVGASVGDFSNNWVGRLAALHANQTTTAKESWKLVEWFLSRCDWLYLVGGNHDAWSGDRDVLSYMTRAGSGLFRYHGVRIALQFPNKREVRVNCRHDFKGWSQWNEVHGVMKAARMSSRDHVFTAGHRHINGLGIVATFDNEGPIVAKCIRVASYKVYDEYAEKIGAYNSPPAPAVVTIIDPAEKDPYELVRVRWNVQDAAEELTWRRSRA